MKKIFAVLLCYFMAFYSFCYSGLFTGADVKIVNTTWFDIVYSQKSEKIASLLYDNADRIYSEVTGQYGLEPDFRMTVVITDSVDMYNAFNTSLPYNRIVMYDTSSQKMDDLSSSISEPFLTTFRHELTHAVTFNMKNGFWNGVTNIFGDSFLPGCFFITPGMAEGAAVASESAGGEGRLNDEYATHFVKQARIEDCFPSFYNTQGAAFTNLPAVHYYFNGPFHAYLQEKYGMEKYEEFWHCVLNLRRPGINWSFRKVFGTSVRKEWKLFAENYPVPDVIKNPVENGVVNDFFLWSDGKPGNISPENKSGARFSEIHGCDTGIFYSIDISNDRNSKKIFFISNDKLNRSGKIKPDILFTHQLVDGFVPSKDGRFLAISYYSTADFNITSKVRIYDVENKYFFDINEDGLKNGSVIKSGNDYYIVGHKYESPYNVLIIKKLLFENGRINDTKNIFSDVQDFNCFVSNFTDLGNGTFAFIKKIEKKFMISISDLAGNIVSEYDLPEDIKIRELSFADNGNSGKIYFSWVKTGSMPRLGFLEPETGLFSFSNTDISGGIFSPVEVKSGDCNKIAYIGRFYKEDRLLTFNMESELVSDSEKYYSGYSKVSSEYDYKKHEDNPDNLIFSDISPISKTYKSFENLHHGLVLPLSTFLTGITYITSNPWNGGNTSDDLLVLSGGWNFLSDYFGFEAMLNQGTGTSLFSYKVDLKTKFNRKGWLESSGDLVLSSGFNFGKTSIFVLQNTTSGYVGRMESSVYLKDDLIDSSVLYGNKIGFNISDMIFAKYSNVCSRGPGKFDSGGISAVLGIGYAYDSVSGSNFIINPSISICVPGFIPVVERRGFTYNLPLRIDLSLLPSKSLYGLTGFIPGTAKQGVLDTTVEAVLFGIDIQKSIPFVEAFFINEFYITGGYCSTIAAYNGYHDSEFQLPYIFEYFGNLGNGKSAYMDSVYLQAVLKLTPNIGLLATPTGMATFNIYGRVSYPINVIDESYKHFNFSFGIKANF